MADAMLLLTGSLAVFVVIPALAYLVAKMVTYGRLKAQRQFRDNYPDERGTHGDKT